MNVLRSFPRLARQTVCVLLGGVAMSCHRDAAESAKTPAKPSPQPIVHTVTGSLRYHPNFHSAILGNDRMLFVWLPPGYESDRFARYPVLYMHDGQNLFDDATSVGLGEWHADEIATALIAQKVIEPIIIVGIANVGPARADEYTPTRKPIYDYINFSNSGFSLSFKPIPMEGGDGEAYARFLIDEVKPFIDRTYRTLRDRRHTAVAGSSLGGLMSLYLGWKHGDVFGMCACISPSLWWDKEYMLHQLQTDNAWMRREKFWLDIGTDEGGGVNPQLNVVNTRTLRAIMLKAGLVEGRDFEYLEIPGGRHDEQSWAQRFDQVLEFFFPSS